MKPLSILLAVVLLACLCLWAMRDSNPAAALDPREQRIEDASAQPPTSGTVDAVVATDRTPAIGFPDGRLWVRTAATDGRAPPPLSWSIVPKHARSFREVQPLVPEDDGWAKIDLPASGVPADGELAIVSPGHNVAWLAQPTTSERHTIRLLPVRGDIRVRDVPNASPVAGAHLCASRSSLPRGELDAAHGAWPGHDPDTAIYHITETEPGTYRANGDLPDGDYRLAAEHPHYVLALASDQKMAVSAGRADAWLQMPVVASIRYVGDDLLEGGIRFPSGSVQDPATIRRLREMLAGLPGSKERALTCLFLEDIALDKPRKHTHAVALTKLVHGEQRRDRVPIALLAEFERPFEVHVTPEGDAIVPQPVRVVGPPAFAGVQPRFRALVVPVDGAQPRPVTVGDTLDLPPGEYQVLGSAGYVWEAIERTRFTVEPGKPTEFHLKWRKGLFMHQAKVSGHGDLKKIQFHVDTGEKTFVVDTLVEPSGDAYFWIGTQVLAATVYAKGRKPTPMVFQSTQDPKVLTGTCHLEPTNGGN